jgi:hypothetical protein
VSWRWALFRLLELEQFLVGIIWVLRSQAGGIHLNLITRQEMNLESAALLIARDLNYCAVMSPSLDLFSHPGMPSLRVTLF